ncbi:MAG: hypothetical protein U5K72_09700 [Balneolaceae bacterium]|nr:hypothetical protein [Balneolaceae bacterium]
MQRLFNALFIGFGLFVFASCSWFLGDYDGPKLVSHSYVQGVTPSNATLYNERTYPTVQANWNGPGGDKIWLAVNLGASAPPENSVDDSNDSAGWYFQFNRKQAFYHNGSNLTPSWTTNEIIEDSGWRIENDPCRILLGDSWRLPTVEELRAFMSAPIDKGGMGDGNRTSAFNSKLKLHAAGNLQSFDGSLQLRGESGNYWASDQFSNKRGEVLTIGEGSNTFAGNKAFGRSVRCLKE